MRRSASLAQVTPPVEWPTTIPEFPDLKPLEISDRTAVEAVTRRLPCSSDHNFTSLWIWNTANSTRIGRLGKNLVIEFAEYETHQPCLTLLGYDGIEDAFERVFSLGAEQLRFIPDFIAEQLPRSRFVIEHDRDQDDYILDVERLATLGGGELSTVRRRANQCTSRLGSRLCVRALAHPRTELLSLFDRWMLSRGKAMGATVGERAAAARLAASWSDLDVRSLALYDDDRLIAAQVYELLPDCAIGHYQKADASYRGIFPLVLRLTAQVLIGLGVRELNLEQDLGIEGLRESKLGYRPIRFVRKYRVRLSEGARRP